MKISSTILLFFLLLTIQITGVNCTDQTRAGVDSSSKLSSPILPSKNNPSGEIGNFVAAAKAAIPGVVHIKTTYNQASAGSANALGQLFGSPSRGSVPATGSGSGVTISADGYIATNNHVIANASSITVIYPDRREFSAKLIGSDPNTDLALLKVNAIGLPVVKMGNSDIMEVGEWVLAVGYPLSLNSTVTAGIISAKGQSIGIINRGDKSRFGNSQPQTSGTAIESFIQTDAAINPGNSGGALVNTNGELIGINTAIASQTGSYAGYAFAIPVNLAKKILDDLQKYGSVKRGILGVSFPSPAAQDQFLKQQGIDPSSVTGVFITGVQPGSAAASAGLKEGDIIQSINGVQLESSSEFSEWIARHKPGDVIKLSYLRNGNPATASVSLKAEEPLKTTAGSAGPLEEIYKKLGATFAPLSTTLKQRFNLNSGVVVTDVLKGGFFDQIGIPRGTIIAFINGKPINNPKDIDVALLSAQRGIIQILAIAPDGSKVVFNFSLGT
ncbi:MAG TPA: trypsin-like peptidase domain-containing protein [Hanamia sp.]|nr:trypsin-like peptidase domain-containing protein [Hanamia sp.]